MAVFKDRSHLVLTLPPNSSKDKLHRRFEFTVDDVVINYEAPAATLSLRKGHLDLPPPLGEPRGSITATFTKVLQSYKAIKKVKKKRRSK